METRPDTLVKAASRGAQHLTDADFDAAVRKGSGLALIDFTATWCPPCRAMSPHIDALAAELDGQVLVAKVDVDESPEAAERFRVMSIPAFLIFRDGEVVERIVGAVPPGRLRARIEELRRATVAA